VFGSAIGLAIADGGNRLDSEDERWLEDVIDASIPACGRTVFVGPDSAPRTSVRDCVRAIPMR